MLDRVRVLRCERHWCREPVVLLVDALVDLGVVQSAVGRVEKHLAGDDRDDEVARDLAQRREPRRSVEE